MTDFNAAESLAMRSLLSAEDFEVVLANLVSDIP